MNAYFLTDDVRSGFGVTPDGTLVGLFSLERGRGEDLVSQATEEGACLLDCFDGFLPSFYARLGWTEVAREANWTPGAPDIVFMARA